MVEGSRTLGRGELLDILGEIYQGRETGTLVLQRDDVSRFLYIQDGQLIFAASNAAEDKFTQILVERGKLTSDQLALAMDKKENRTIGRTLVEMGFLGSDDLLDALVEQMRRIAYSVLNWESGASVFKPGVLPPNIARLPISTPRFIVDLALALEDRDLVAVSLGGLDAPLAASPTDRESARLLPPTPVEWRLIEQVDGIRSAREVCERGGVDLFTGARFLMGLSHLGLVHIAEGRTAPTPAKPVPEPVDLSFLDELPAAAVARPEPAFPPPSEPAAPSQTPVPSRQGLPFGPPSTGGEAKPSILGEDAAPSRADATPRRIKKPRAEPAESLLPIPEADSPSSPPRPAGQEPRFLMEEKRSPVAKWAGIVAVTGAVLGGGFFAVWYFYLRQSPVVPIAPVPPPSQRRGAPNEPPGATQAEPAEVQPGPTVPGEAAPPSPSPSPQDSGAAAGTSKAPSESAEPPGPAGLIQSEAPSPTAPAVPTQRPAAEKPGVAQSASRAPAPAGEGRDLLGKGRFPEAAKAFLAESAGRKAGYAINIEVACQPDTIAKGYTAAGSSADFMILPYSLKGRACYLVLWGYYPDRASADAALAQLPPFFTQSAQPRVIPWSKVADLVGQAP